MFELVTIFLITMFALIFREIYYTLRKKEYKSFKNIMQTAVKIYFVVMFGIFFIGWIKSIWNRDDFTNQLTEYTQNTDIYIDGFKVVEPQKIMKKFIKVQGGHAHGAGELKKIKHTVILSNKEHNMTIILARDSKWKWEYSFSVLEPEQRYIGVVRNIFPVEVYKYKEGLQKVVIKE
jgi:hypothetical protein